VKTTFDVHVRVPDAEALRRLIERLDPEFELLWVEPSRRVGSPLVPQDIPCVAGDQHPNGRSSARAIPKTVGGAAT
jgi:hypothetical protein